MCELCEARSTPRAVHVALPCVSRSFRKARHTSQWGMKRNEGKLHCAVMCTRVGGRVFVGKMLFAWRCSTFLSGLRLSCYAQVPHNIAARSQTQLVRRTFAADHRSDTEASVALGVERAKRSFDALGFNCPQQQESVARRRGAPLGLGLTARGANRQQRARHRRLGVDDVRVETVECESSASPADAVTPEAQVRVGLRTLTLARHLQSRAQHRRSAAEDSLRRN